MKKALAFLVVLAILGAAGAWIWSGRQPAPVITFNGPAFMMSANSEPPAERGIPAMPSKIVSLR